MLPLLLNAVHQGKLTLFDVVRLCCTNPASIFSIEKRGVLKEGNYADICVVDLEKEGPILNEKQHSRCGWTPFRGLNVKGWPVMTLVNGNIVY